MRLLRTIFYIGNSVSYRKTEGSKFYGAVNEAFRYGVANAFALRHREKFHGCTRPRGGRVTRVYSALLDVSGAEQNPSQETWVLVS